MAKSQDKGDEYEKAILEKLKYEFGEKYRIERNYVIHNGLISKGKVQFDIAIYRKNEANPFWLIECKAWKKNSMKKFIDQVRLTPTKLEELSSSIEVYTFIMQNEPNESAKNIIEYKGFRYEVISEKEAIERDWYYVAHKIFPFDVEFHSIMNTAINEVVNNNNQKAVEELENIPYEEWLAVIDYSFDKYPNTIEKLLRLVAEYHYDDGWRYNAIQKLDEYNTLDEEFVSILLNKEKDYDTRELLLSIN